MKSHKLVNPAIRHWAIILADTLIAAICLAISCAMAPSDGASDCTSFYFAAVIGSCIVGSVWVPPLVNMPGTRFYRIMERSFHKVLLTGLLVTACVFFNSKADILRTLMIAFLPLFFIFLLLTRMGEHAFFKRSFAKASDCELEATEMPHGLHYIWNRMVKRGFDILLALLFLCTVYPPVYLAVFLYSKIKTGGPVCSFRRLTSLNGKTFTCFTFSALGNDNILNTFPCFFSVLIGDMSIVGSRYYPLSAGMSNDEDENENRNAFIGKPGLAGWAAQEGCRNAEEEKELDQWYADNWSFGLDVFIILKGLGNLIFKGKRNK